MKNAIILAAGKGSRMKSELPKVLHKVDGIPMVRHVINSVRESGINAVLVVVGHKSDMIKEELGEEVFYALQEEQLGTGHAVLQALEQLPENGDTLVITGDTPLVMSDTISKLMETHKKSNNKGTVLTTIVTDPKGYGRIINDSNGNILSIIEEKDATESQKMIREVNTGIFCFDNKCLREKIYNLKNNNNQNEYYLTDLVDIFLKSDLKFGTSLVSDSEQVMGINDIEQLNTAENILKMRNIRALQ